MSKGCGENPSRRDVVSALNCKKLISVVFVSPKVIQKSDYCKNDSVTKGVLNRIARFQNARYSDFFHGDTIFTTRDRFPTFARKIKIIEFSVNLKYSLGKSPIRENQQLVALSRVCADCSFP